MSFTDLNIISKQPAKFMGLKNYIKMFGDDRFWNSLRVAAIYGVGSVGLQVLFGFIISLLVVQTYNLARTSRVLLLLPMTTPPIVASLMWKLFFTPGNPGMNYVLGLFGIQGPSWFDSGTTALAAIILANVWQWTPFCMLLFTAALESLPASPFESAIVDGASSWQRFHLITLPLMKPAIVFVTTFRLIESLKIFPLVYVMTGGGPGTSTEPINFYAFSTAFEFNRIGYGSTLVIFMVLLVILIMLVIRRQDYEVG
jgi:multiple sugar transport system permease protein